MSCQLTGSKRAAHNSHNYKTTIEREHTKIGTVERIITNFRKLIAHQLLYLNGVVVLELVVQYHSAQNLDETRAEHKIMFKREATDDLVNI